MPNGGEAAERPGCSHSDGRAARGNRSGRSLGISSKVEVVAPSDPAISLLVTCLRATVRTVVNGKADDLTQFIARREQAVALIVLRKAGYHFLITRLSNAKLWIMNCVRAGVVILCSWHHELVRGFWKASDAGEQSGIRPVCTSNCTSMAKTTHVLEVKQFTKAGDSGPPCSMCPAGFRVSMDFHSSHAHLTISW